MKFTQTGTFKENYLETQTDFKPLESIRNVFLDKLEYFVGFIAKKNQK
ncbi:MAG: hypothetical protein KGD59_03650 [Candidatus Heimdallarchaeota archaeon]|nr:hypothetical protein [Candidatus Heimdallarchaeota archaeon]